MFEFSGFRLEILGFRILDCSTGQCPGDGHADELSNGLVLTSSFMGADSGCIEQTNVDSQLHKDSWGIWAKQVCRNCAFRSTTGMFPTHTLLPSPTSRTCTI